MSDLSRSKTGAGSSFLSRRFTGLTLVSRGNASESNEEIHGPLGLNLLHEPSEPFIDFVFVHGLRGGSRKTWSKSENKAHFWPKEWLPVEPRFKNVRIHSFGYDSDWGDRKASQVTVHDLGQALLGDVANNPALNGRGNDSPLVMVGHSMGGVIIKKMLMLAKQNSAHWGLANRVHSMFFLATPHRGADSAQLLSNLLKITVSHGSKSYVDNLVPNSDAIQVINDEFRNVYGGIQLWSFFETRPTSIGIIVGKESATLGLPGERVQLLNADHRHVCKFDDPADPNYCTLRNAFVSTIDTIERTSLFQRQDEHKREMKELSLYLGLLETPEADFADIVDLKTEGSCCWLTDKTSFQDWQQGPDGYPKHFWLSGEPAVGKSTLAAHVIKYLEECNSDCSYFFFKQGGSGKSIVADLLCSLAWQMAYANKSIRQRILLMQKEEVLINRSDEGCVWRVVFLARIFRTELRQPHYWVIDGLDECDNHSALFPLLGKIDKSFPLKVFMTSRPSLAIERYFLQERVTTVAEVVERTNSMHDIELFLQAHAHYLLVANDSDRLRLVRQILQKSNGNFLWTRLVVKELEEAHSEQRVREVLESVPRGMDELYSRILTNLLATPRNTELVMAILRWCVCAARPLSVDELREALRLDIGEVLPQLEKSAGSICGYLVYVDQQSKVRIAHQTVKEYLFRGHESSRFRIKRPEAHLRIAGVCLSYLCDEEMKPPRYRRGNTVSRARKRSTFSVYGTRYFSGHVARSTSSDDTQLLCLNSFLQSNSLTWIEMIAASGDLSSLTEAAKYFKDFLERRAKYRSPIGKEVQNVSEWANDLIRLVAQFGGMLVKTPSAVHFLVPPVCPPESIIFRTFGESPRGLRLVGLSQKQWDDRLCCIVSHQNQVLSVACRDNKVALGLSDGTVSVYHESTFQIKCRLRHGEQVRRIAFATNNIYIASVGRRKLCLWNTATRELLWTASLRDQPVALEFSEDDAVVMAATKANSVGFWDVESGKALDVAQFCDYDEEEKEEHHYRRSPMLASISPGLKLLGVVYRSRPIIFWDLEEQTYVGQYQRSRGGGASPEPLILAFLLNPKPEISLAAVAYQDGDIVVFDPWSQETEAIADADASTLAASPDGTVLATGSGDGVIKLYDFETLTLFYQINSYQQDIRALSFNSNGLRFLDIREDYCNVWEPSVLVRRVARGDDSSIDISERVIDGPQITTTQALAETLAITAMVAHHESEYVFCGRENGSVAAISITTGYVAQQLFSHGKNIAVISLEWNPRANILATVDRSGCCTVRKVLRALPGPFESQGPMIQRKLSCAVHQTLLSNEGERFLVSTAEADSIMRLDNGSVLNHAIVNSSRSSWRWMNHPVDSGKLMLIVDGEVNVYDWQDFTNLFKVKCIEFDTNIEKTPPETTIAAPSVQSNHVCMAFFGPKAGGFAPMLRVWPSKLFLPGDHLAKATAIWDALAKEVKCIIGVYKSLLVFLADSGWVCSLDMDETRAIKYYTKHFYVPQNWHTSIQDIAMTASKKGVVIIAVKNEVAIFQNGLDFEERVGYDGTTVSAEASMRSVLKRGVSSPV